MIHLMTVPAKLLADVSSGAAYVTGALVKDGATHQILAHLQPTSLLSQAFSLAASGPLAPLQLVSTLGQSFQLFKIQQMLDTVRTVASIGAAASVLNLGVSVGGFALVLSALKKADAKLDGIQSTVQALARNADAEFFARITTVMRRSEDGFELPTPDRRHRWLEVERELDGLIEEVLNRMVLMGIALERTPSAGDAPDLDQWRRIAQPDVFQQLGRLFSLAAARSEALLCLQRPAQAARQSQRAALWLSALPTDAKAVTLARVAGRALPTEQLAHLARQSKALTTWVARGSEATNERALICQTLHDRDIDTEAYVLQVRQHPLPELLMLSHQQGVYAERAVS